MTFMGWADARDKNEIIDFADYVFSKAHEPHDFASLLPKLYGEMGDAACHHILVREEGRIAAAMLCYPVVMNVAGQKLMTIGIGTVSTHPRARGKGYLGAMMEMADARAKELGAAFAVLGGQRQRYQYYGFDLAGYQLRALLTKDNVRHALRDVKTDGFALAAMTQEHVAAARALDAAQPCCCERSESAYLEILRTWNNTPYAVMKDGAFAGYVTLRRNADASHAAQLTLENEDDFAPVMKLLSGLYGHISLCAAPWEKRRAKWLSSICSEYAVTPNGMYKIYDEEKTHQAFSQLDGFMPMALPLYVAPPDGV